MPFLLAERARYNRARSMRAVEGSLGRSFGEKYRELEGSRSTSAVESFPHPRLVGEVRENKRWTRAVEDHQSPSLKRAQASLEGALEGGLDALLRVSNAQSQKTFVGHAQRETIYPAL